MACNYRFNFVKCKFKTNSEATLYSYFVFLQNPKAIQFDKSIVEVVGKIYFQQLIDAIIDGWQNKGLEPKIFDKLKVLRDVAYDEALKEYLNNVYNLTVINHGDLWIGNILYSYDGSGNPTDAKFVCNYFY